MAEQSPQAKTSISSTTCLAPYKDIIEVESPQDNDLRRALHVEIIDQAGPVCDLTTAKRVMVYDIVGNGMILSQASPPIPPDKQGSVFHVIFDTTRMGKTTRKVFKGKLLGFVQNYPLESNRRVQAIVLKQISEPTYFGSTN
jgi:hypothetical protein